jgi:HEPN domain-containing protein
MHARGRDWWEEARADLDAARTLRGGKHFNNAVYMARQAVEKALKSCYLTLKEEMPPLSHGLRSMARELFDGVPRRIWIVLSNLDGEYTATRYPSNIYTRPSEAYTETDADLAIDGAEEVLEWLSGFFDEGS